jgi:hypothetical protein
MDLDFFNKKPKKQDIPLVKINSIKKLEFSLIKKKPRTNLENLLDTISPLGVGWVLEIPNGGGSEHYLVRTNRPIMSNNNYRDAYGYGGGRLSRSRYVVDDHYFELVTPDERGVLADWFYRGQSKINLTLSLLCRNGNVEERWVLVGCSPISLDYNMDYMDSETTTSLRIRIDYTNLIQ